MKESTGAYMYSIKSSNSVVSCCALTVSQTCQALQVSKPKLYDLIRTGHIAAFRIGRNWRVTEEALRAFMGLDDAAVVSLDPAATNSVGTNGR